MPHPATPESSNGWEAFAAEFMAMAPGQTIGAEAVRRWAVAFPAGVPVLDLGCGPGCPRSAGLHEAGLSVYAIDASPTLAEAYRVRFPAARVMCEAAEDSRFFRRTYRGALAWGLVFLLAPEAQRRLIRNVAAVLEPGGRFLFTAPAQAVEWADASTGRRSVSLGRGAYEEVLSGAGLRLEATSVDEGENFYYDTIRADG